MRHNPLSWDIQPVNEINIKCLFSSDWLECHFTEEQYFKKHCKFISSLHINTGIIDDCDIHTHSCKVHKLQSGNPGTHYELSKQPWIIRGSTQNVIQSKPSRWRCDWCKHARAATRKTTSHDTSFTIAAAGAYTLMLCLSCQCSSTYSASRSRTASRLFVPLIPRFTSAIPCIRNLWLISLTSSLCALETKKKEEKIAPIVAPWSLFQKQWEVLFMRAYHWK